MCQIYVDWREGYQDSEGLTMVNLWLLLNTNLEFGGQGFVFGGARKIVNAPVCEYTCFICLLKWYGCALTETTEFFQPSVHIANEWIHSYRFPFFTKDFVCHQVDSKVQALRETLQRFY